MNDCTDATPVPPIDAREFAARRQRFIDQLAPNSIAILKAAPEQIRNGDTHYRYRQDSSFYYLTGLSEPDAIAVFITGVSSRYVLFTRDRDPAREKWDGPRAGQRGACDSYGADEAYPIQDFDEKAADWFIACHQLYWFLGRDAIFDQRIFAIVEQLREKVRKAVSIPTVYLDLAPIVHEMRLIKSPAEIALMRHACQISTRGHLRALEQCRPGVREYALEAALSYEFTRAGSQSPAYPSIVGGGANSCVLHYIQNTDTLQDGDVVLIDAGCEYQNYASDITRTLPVNGRFTKEQRAIYTLVLAAQTAAIAQIRPGVMWSSLQETIVRYLTEGLVKLGILQGDVDTLIQTKAYQTVYMHNSGHWIGLDVHDAGEYQREGLWRPLEVGMVLTVEPGLYITANTEGIDKKWWNIGVRIEDDVLVTQDGYDILSKDLPREIDAIEALMARSST